MYLARFDNRVAPGRDKEFEEWWCSRAASLRAARGFQVGLLCASLGEPGTYTSLFRWQDRASATSYRQSGAISRDMETRSPGLAASTRPSQAFELVFRVGDPNLCDIKIGVGVAWHLRPGAAASFEASRHDRMELLQKHAPGYISGAMYRHLGDPNRYWLAWAWGNEEAARAANTLPALAVFSRDHPSSLYADQLPTVETTEIVQRI